MTNNYDQIGVFTPRICILRIRLELLNIKELIKSHSKAKFEALSFAVHRHIHYCQHLLYSIQLQFAIGHWRKNMKLETLCIVIIVLFDIGSVSIEFMR